MTKKKKRRRRASRRNIKKIWIFVIITVILLLLFVMLWKVAGSKKTEDKQGNETTRQQIEFPYNLEDGKIEVTSLFQYTGMNPDCKDEFGEDIASLEVTNKSDEYLANIELTVELENGTKIPFVATDIPAGQVVWVYAADNNSYDTSVACVDITCEAVFDETASLMEDKLTIDVQETTVTLTNVSEEELIDLSVDCHCLFEEAYFGGLTYTYPVESIPAGESITIQAEECYLGEAVVVRVNQGD